MKLRIYLILALFFFSFLQNLNAQKKLDPIFSAFNGSVYRVPDVQLTQGYHDQIESDYKLLTEIVLYKLDIPEREDKILMEGIERRSRFGIIFESKMKIKKDGWYQFSLNSDDGSILWIDEKMILDNDGLHKMTMVKDSVQLKEGVYPIKIWYYQGFPDRYGIEFKSSFYRESTLSEKSQLSMPKVTVFPSHALNFENNIFGIDENGKALLGNFAKKIEKANIQKITIIGHTDAKASEEYNNQLSWKRANAVCNELKQFLVGKNIEFSVVGKGESEPIASNETEEGRAKNRRVEVVVE